MNSDTSSHTGDTSDIDPTDPIWQDISQTATFTKEQFDGYYTSAKFVFNQSYYGLGYEFGAKYKVIKSYEELNVIDEGTALEASIFDENYILIVYRHYNGGMQYDYIGYKNVCINDKELEITLDCYEREEDTNDQYVEIETVEYLIVPTVQLDSLSNDEGTLTINYNERDFYERIWYSVDEEIAQNFANGTTWLFQNVDDYINLMEHFGARHYIDGFEHLARLVIFYEAGTNIGIGYSNCNTEGNKFYITNEAFVDDNIILNEPLICVIFINKSNFSDGILENYNFNIVIQENIVERLYSSEE